MEASRSISRARVLPPGRSLALGGVLVLSLGLNLWNNDFLLGYHRDEPKKVRFILQGEQDFHHPLLMLQEARIVNRVLGLEPKQDVAVMGRTMSALNATLAVLVLFLLARRRLPHPYALWTTLAAAVSPILVVHAHYLKEDVLLTLFCLLTLLTLFRYLERPVWQRAVLLGLCAGLGTAAHFKAGLLFPVLAAAPLLGPFPDRRRLYRGLLVAVAVAAAAFLFVNYPIVLHPRRSGVLTGLIHDLNLIGDGKDVRIDPLSQRFAFHLRHSLVPGMTLLAVTIGLAGAAVAALRWKILEAPERILLVYLALFYASIEITPFKPYPDFMRYAMPLVPVLLYFGVRLIEALRRVVPGPAGRLCVAVFLALLIVAPLQVSLRLDYYLTRDTRAEADQRAPALGGTVLFGNYASLDSRRQFADDSLDSLSAEGVTHIAVSSFDYDRYLFAGKLQNQVASAYRRARAYEAMFRLPYIEISPAYRAFAFSNPVIRIVDIRSGSAGEGR
jgi:hypothetical protein